MLRAVAAEAARRFGDRTAYVAVDGWPLSYAELDRASDEVAVAMAARGVGEGDVVALVLPAVPEYAIAYLAAAKLGAVTAGVNARLAAPERDALLEAAQPRLVLATADLAPKGPWPVEIVTPAGATDLLLAGLRAPGERPPPLADDPQRPLAVVFTSGTTGTPKGAVFAGRQLSFISDVDTGGRWDGGGDQIAGTSFAHLAFMTKFPGKLMGGGVTYMVERWRAADALAMTAEHRLTRIGGIPTQVALMLRDPSFDDYDLSAVRVIVIGGGPATPALVREARERFGCPVLVRYSCTEAGVGTGTALDDPDEDAEISVGRPLPGVELRIADPDAEGRGEVCLRSPAVMSGYWRAPAATAEALTDDGFVRTGDVGWVDDLGRLRLAGRSKEMYVRGGYNVYPVQVEGVLARHPGVADVAVVPHPDDVMGEIGVAVVVPADPNAAPGLEALREFAAGELARHELPEALLVVDDLPLTPMEKVDRRALAALVHTSDDPSENER